MGKEKLTPTIRDQANSLHFQLSCVAKEGLNEDHILTDNDIAFSRPGDGLPPKMKPFLIGKKLETQNRLELNSVLKTLFNETNQERYYCFRCRL